MNFNLIFVFALLFSSITLAQGLIEPFVNALDLIALSVNSLLNALMGQNPQPEPEPASNDEICLEDICVNLSCDVTEGLVACADVQDIIPASTLTCCSLAPGSGEGFCTNTDVNPSACGPNCQVCDPGEVCDQGSCTTQGNGVCEPFSLDGENCASTADCSCEVYEPGTTCNTNPNSSNYGQCCSGSNCCQPGVTGDCTGSGFVPSDLCGNFVCEPNEDSESCELDCYCGNGLCDTQSGETCTNCNSDCTCDHSATCPSGSCSDDYSGVYYYCPTTNTYHCDKGCGSECSNDLDCPGSQVCLDFGNGCTNLNDPDVCTCGTAGQC